MVDGWDRWVFYRVAGPFSPQPRKGHRLCLLYCQLEVNNRGGMRGMMVDRWDQWVFYIVAGPFSPQLRIGCRHCPSCSLLKVTLWGGGRGK